MSIKDKWSNNKNSIKTHIFFSFLGVGIIPLILYSLIAGVIMKSSMYKSEISSLRQISSLITENLDKWGDDNILLVEDIASSQIIKGNNKELIQNELKNKQGQNTSIINIMYTDLNGNVIADSLGSMNLNIKNESYFNDVCSDYSVVSNVITNENGSFIIFSSPVKNDNKVIGYILNKVNSDSIGKSIGKIIYSDKGQAFTFNSNGYITYHKDSSKIMSENLLDAKSTFKFGAQKALEGNFNSIDYKYEGEKGSAVYNFIPSLKWGTIVTIPNSDIYSGFKAVFSATVPVMIIIIALIIVFTIHVVKKFLTIIKKVLYFTKDVAEGNLSIKSDLNGTAEITNIGENLNEMASNLKNLVLSINESSTALMGASIELGELSESAENNSKDISKAMDEIANGSVVQAERTEEVLNQVRNLDAQMHELIDNVNKTNKALSISDKALSKGNKETVQLESRTKEQSNLVSKAVNEVNDLAAKVESIDTIIETIVEIAEQTNLLALNASIEAARAGENGKGFAVVAEEVAKLASESQGSTKKISLILEDIKSKADLAKNIMGSIDDGMELQISSVKDTMDTFKEIANADSNISDNIKSFSSLIEYIKKFNEGLLELIESLASSAEESAAVAEEVTASTEDQINVVENVRLSGDNILKSANELKENISKFKTE